MPLRFLIVLLTTSFLCLPAAAQRGGFRGGFGGPTGPKIEPEKLDFEMGVATIPDRAMYEKLSYKGDDVKRDGYLANLQFVKFIISDPFEDDADVYFMNTKNHRAHPPWMGQVGVNTRVRGAITYHPRVQAPDGTAGLYVMDFQPNDSYSYEQMRFVYDLLVREAPVLKGKFSFHPLRGNLGRYEEEKSMYEKGKLPVHLDEHLFERIAFLPLNSATSYGRLTIMQENGRPSPRDIVICRTLPNEMPRVAGVISEVRQTPLSHVNLRAVQDKVPNAYINDALGNQSIKSLVGKLVAYTVKPAGYSLRLASVAEVDKHFASLRPSKPQEPKRDLTAREVLPLDEIRFEHANRFGTKAANLATMRTFEFPGGTIPNGHAVPFYFYDEFMKHNGFYKLVDEVLQDERSQGDRGAQEKALAALRGKIEKGSMPDWMMAALGKVQASFPKGSSIRCRSSTNNEDLPGFSGAGLYDSCTHKPDEGHLSESIKQVYASLWNLRAFEEREFYRIDHNLTAMGVLLHPNFKEEKANGVAVTDDILYEQQGYYYINTRLGEDLVTNPEAESSPEETLLGWYERDGHQIVRRSEQIAADKSLLTDAHRAELREYLGRIHVRFAELYGRDKEDLKFAMEIEFKITEAGKLVIKQVRPWVF